MFRLSQKGKVGPTRFRPRDRRPPIPSNSHLLPGVSTMYWLEKKNNGPGKWNEPHLYQGPTCFKQANQKGHLWFQASIWLRPLRKTKKHISVSDKFRFYNPQGKITNTILEQLVARGSPASALRARSPRSALRPRWRLMCRSRSRPAKRGSSGAGCRVLVPWIGSPWGSNHMSHNQNPVQKMVDPEPRKELRRRPQLWLGSSLTNLHLPGF